MKNLIGTGCENSHDASLIYQGKAKLYENLQKGDKEGGRRCLIGVCILFIKYSCFALNNKFLSQRLMQQVKNGKNL